MNAARNDDSEQPADVRRRYFDLRMAVRALVNQAGSEPEDPARRRQRELAAEVAAADRESTARIPRRLPQLEAMLEQRGLLEAALRQLRSIEDIDDGRA